LLADAETASAGVQARATAAVSSPEALATVLALTALPDGLPDGLRVTDGHFLFGEPRQHLFVLQVLRC
jgi:hypothetical protein